MSETKEEKYTRFIDGIFEKIIVEGEDIVTLCKWYKSHPWELGHHADSLKSKIEGHVKVMFFKIDNAKKWYDKKEKNNGTL